MPSYLEWFKCGTGIEDDPRLLELDDHQFRIWMVLQAVASKAEERGVIPPYPLRGLAGRLRTTPQALRSALDLFAELGLLELTDEGSIVVTEFLKQQYDKPSDQPQQARARQQKSRENQRHANVTPMSRAVTPIEGGDLEVEKERRSRGEGLGDKPAREAAPAPTRDVAVVTTLRETVPKPDGVDQPLWLWWVDLVAKRASHAGRDPAEMLAGIDLVNEIEAWNDKEPGKRSELKVWLRRKTGFWLDDNPAGAPVKGATNGRAQGQVASRAGSDGPGGAGVYPGTPTPELIAAENDKLDEWINQASA